MLSQCLICRQHQAASGRFLCDQCLAYELTMAVRKGHVGEGFIGDPTGRRPTDYDTFEALAANGDLAVNFLDMESLTLDEALHLIQGEEESERAQIARQALIKQEVLIGMLQIAFPKQVALALIWTTADETTFRTASAWLVDQFHWKIDARRTRLVAALRARAIEEGRSRFAVKRDLLVSALLLVRGHMSTPRFMRFGRHWVKDGTGRRAQLTPATDLRWLYLWRWIHHWACRLAEADLLGETVPLPDDEHDYELVDVETLREMLTHLGVTDRDQEIWLMSAARLTAPHIAKQLGMKPGTVRVRLHRLRETHGPALARLAELYVT